jgi:Protein of unknown function (DUF3489)
MRTPKQPNGISGTVSGTPAPNAPLQHADLNGPTRSNSSTTPDHAATRRAPRPTQLLAMLSTETGASLDDICAVFGWQPHSARAALSGLRKAGIAIERINLSPPELGIASPAKGSSRYRANLADGRMS